MVEDGFGMLIEHESQRWFVIQIMGKSPRDGFQYVLAVNASVMGFDKDVQREGSSFPVQLIRLSASEISQVIRKESDKLHDPPGLSDPGYSPESPRPCDICGKLSFTHSDDHECSLCGTDYNECCHNDEMSCCVNCARPYKDAGLIK